jgi:N-methylhydantoinase B
VVLSVSVQSSPFRRPAPDTGGPGKFRRGPALERQYRFFEAEGTLQLRTDRSKHVPYGLAGGRPGTPSRNVLNPGTEDRELPAKCTLTVRSGDVYRHELAGAGGWGDPFERDPERVLRDVMEEKISVAYARREYGVVIDERTWKIVLEETARLRAAAQTAR